MLTKINLYRIFALLLLVLSSPSILATPLTGEYKTCFTPPSKCSTIIVEEINKATSSIYVQAYGFTSKEIIAALIDAKKRGVEVYIILDKSNFSERYKGNLEQLYKAGISIFKDKISGIAHNKVMIIDNTVITGSFNFTKNADTRNAENVIILTNEDIAQVYYRNWMLRRNER